MPRLAIGIAGPVDEPDRNVDADHANVVGAELTEHRSDSRTDEDAILEVDHNPTALETVHAANAHGDECSGNGAESWERSAVLRAGTPHRHRAIFRTLEPRSRA
jgi:hypothetical protein